MQNIVVSVEGKNGMLISRGIHYGLVWRICVLFILPRVFSATTWLVAVIATRNQILLFSNCVGTDCYSTVMHLIYSFWKTNLRMFVSFLSQTNWSFCFANSIGVRARRIGREKINHGILHQPTEMEAIRKVATTFSSRFARTLLPLLMQRYSWPPF